jgi:hypothetical protein
MNSKRICKKTIHIVKLIMKKLDFTNNLFIFVQIYFIFMEDIIRQFVAKNSDGSIFGDISAFTQYMQDACNHISDLADEIAETEYQG